jgi:uncharacterized protein
VIATLDASVLVPLMVVEESSVAMQNWVSAYEGRLIVSEFAAAEASSGISKLVRMKRLSADEASAALDEFDAWRFSVTETINIGEADFRAAHLLVRRFETKLRAPDALHLAVARRLDATLVTRDQILRDAAMLVGVGVDAP